MTQIVVVTIDVDQVVHSSVRPVKCGFVIATVCIKNTQQWYF